MLDPQGQVVPVAPSEAAARQAAGFIPLTPEDAAKIALQKQFGGVGGEAAAAAAGVGRGLTFGASDAALTGSGLVAPETLKGLKEANPIASTAGLVAGAALPVLATAGEAAPLEAAAAGAEGAGALARAGQGARGFLEAVGAMPRAAAAAGEAVEGAVGGALGEGLGARLAATGARGAVEGGLYGAGDAVSESAIENKPLTAESLIASVGPSAFFGGALGAGAEAAMGIGRAVLPKALEKAGSALDSLAERTAPKELELPAKGAPELPAAPAPREAPAPKPLPDTAANVRAVAKDLGEAHGQVDDALARYFTEDKPARIEQLLGASDQARPAAKTLVGDLQARLEAVPHTTTALKEARAELGRISEVVATAKNDAEVFNALDKGKSKIQKLLKYDRELGPEANASLQPLRDAASSWRAALEDPEIWGKEAATFQRETNGLLTSHFRAKEALEKELFSRALTPEEREAGKLVVDKGAVQAYLKQRAVGDPRADRLAGIVQSYTDNSRALLDHLAESTYHELPSKAAEARSLRDFLGQFQGKAEAGASSFTEAKATAAANKQAAREHARAVQSELKDHAADTKAAQRAYDAQYRGQVKAAKAAAAAAKGSRLEHMESLLLLSHAAHAVLPPGVGTALVMAVKLTREAEVVSAISRKAAEVSRKLSAGIKAGLEGGGSGARPAFTLAGVSFGRASHPGETRAEALARHAADHAELGADPAAMAQRLADATPSLTRHAPTVGGLAQQTAVRAQQFLAQAAPKSPVPTSGLPASRSGSRTRSRPRATSGWCGRWSSR
jgi:hypothetical protein